MKEDKENDFIVNENLTIKNFEFVSNKVFVFKKFGQDYNYKEFTGLVNGRGVKGFVCLEDDNIYKMEWLK